MLHAKFQDHMTISYVHRRNVLKVFTIYHGHVYKIAFPLPKEVPIEI